MFESFINILTSIAIGGTTMDTVRLLRDILRNDYKPNENDVIDNIDEVKKKLEESQSIISKAISDIEKQKKEFESLKKEAEISKNVAQLTEEQRDAVKNLLDGALDDSAKKSLWINIGVSFFFCVLSVLLGFYIGKVWG
jgi:Zn-dependent M16 (insulinase) family peptidase